MRWQDSIKTKNIIFFSLISFLFLFSIMLGFSLLKTKELPAMAESEITLSTHKVIRELLIEEYNNEQSVIFLTTIASKNSSKDLIKKVLNSNKNQEIISVSIYVDNKSMYFMRNGNNFKELVNKEDKKLYSFEHHLKNEETFWTKVYFDTITKTKIISLISPIYRGKKYVGLVSLNIKFCLCENNIFESLLNSKEKYFMIIDRAGNFVMSSEIINKSAKNNDIKSLNIPILQELLYKRSVSENKLEYKKSRYTKRVKRTITMLDNDPIFNEKSVVASYYFPHTGWKMLISIPNHIIFQHVNDLYENIILMIVLFSIITAFTGYYMIKKTIVSPLISISNQIQNGGINTDVMIHTKEKGEIELVVYKLNSRNKALKIAHNKDIKNEKLLLQQSKMAAIGEMLDAVAHQWKQPLNALSMHTELIVMDYESGDIDKKYMNQFQKDVQLQIQHMENTLNTFRNFFRPDTKMEKFNLIEVVDDVLLLAKDELIKNLIEIEVDEKDLLKIYGSKNELRHLILNIINNAKDAFKDNNTNNRLIKINLFIDNNKKILEIQDNAGGIPTDIIKDIFKAHVTTKSATKGTGIGLYMSTQIAQKHNAKLDVFNKDGGASFRLTFYSLK